MSEFDILLDIIMRGAAIGLGILLALAVLEPWRKWREQRRDQHHERTPQRGLRSDKWFSDD